ncbi:DUF7541 family protein [Halorarius litoreus]|uniref:DUF7541 family protein n=1 Tax=Halorarius litoreus TaxID=2962676 RepID=UPI0020CF3805|nr:cox cluster protein [Halorarius litoreus]
MTEDADAPAVSTADKASPWPLFVALGLAVGEVGVFMGLYPVAVAGLLLFVGSVAGIVTEAGYAERPWKLLGGLGGLLVVVGIWVVSTQIDAGTAAAWMGALDAPGTIVLRGFSIAAAGVIALVASGAFAVVEPDLATANQ